MEFSSPLAAMQPPPQPWAFGRDIPNSRPRHTTSSSFAGNSFNFRDMSMIKPQSDYFTLRSIPLRGSSPTASLAADLSQNFHIEVDQSPQRPTPRRSLFTAKIFSSNANREGATTPPASWEGVTTPPIPSSSPCFGGDSMDISPLLTHKPPFSFSDAIKMRSPTPEPTQDQDQDMATPSEPQANIYLQVPQIVTLPERKRSSLSRPSLARTKCHSTTAISQQSNQIENQQPPFIFGAGGKGLAACASLASLDDCFVESPPREKNPFDNSLGCPTRSRSLFIGSNSSSRLVCSPMIVQPKRNGNPLARPRKQFRRSLSMFEHPGDVLKKDKAYVPSALQESMDFVEAPAQKLPHFFSQDEEAGNCSLPRIDHCTLLKVMDGQYDALFDRRLVVDCRFEYEYEGGHIDGAHNFNDKEHLVRELFSSTYPPNTLLIFHCEYSRHRAPLMATYVRQQDRTANAASYPHLSFPEVYILHGGYSSFFENHRPRCFPPNYVLMHDQDHKHACERGLNKIKQRQKLTRAQTYAFGQLECEMEDSPSRAAYGEDFLEMDLASSRMHTRRLVSY